MNRNEVSVLGRREASVLATNKVLRNTYILLSLCFLFSAFTAWIAYEIKAPSMGLFMLLGAYGLMFLTVKFSNSSLGLLFVFAFTGFMGYTIGPVISYYFANYTNGYQLVTTALGGTGIIFFALSGYALTTRKDFSYLSGFLFTGFMIALLAMIAAYFIQIPALNLAVSAAFMLLSSALILHKTSQIIHGGETNYILATVTIFVSIYNLFVSLLQILGGLSGRD